MKLINTESREIEEFVVPPPQYATLSHRWGDEEVTFQEWGSRMTRPDVLLRRGYQKIESFCDLVKQSNLKYAWVDTCCIDKSSSQELSEAINSMFLWYKNCTTCIVYLDDCQSFEFRKDDVQDCVWWIRGWTLQELLAPASVSFYNIDWQLIGSKRDPGIFEAIEDITGIDARYLLGSNLESASIAKKMSWAAKRITTRPEDQAYSLLGLFDINMPLLYGEGSSKAFARLQKEIMTENPEDHTLFAWGVAKDRCSNDVSIEEAVRLPHTVSSPRPISSEPLYGLLAPSPKDFALSGNLSPLPWAGAWYVTRGRGLQPASYPISTGRSVKVELPQNEFRGIVPLYYQFSELKIPQIRHGFYVVLLCQDDTDPSVMFCLCCMDWGAGYVGRTGWGAGYVGRTGELFRERRFPEWPNVEYRTLLPMKRSFTFAPEKKRQLRHGDVVLRCLLDLRTSENRSRFNVSRSFTSHHVEQFSLDLIIRPRNTLEGQYQTVSFRKADQSLEDWSIVIGRTGTESADRPLLQIGITYDRASSMDFPMLVTAQQEFSGGRSFENLCLDITGLPLVDVRVERVGLLPGTKFVDVVDIVLRDRVSDEEAAGQAQRLQQSPVLNF